MNSRINRFIFFVLTFVVLLSFCACTNKGKNAMSSMDDIISSKVEAVASIEDESNSDSMEDNDSDSSIEESVLASEEKSFPESMEESSVDLPDIVDTSFAENSNEDNVSVDDESSKTENSAIIEHEESMTEIQRNSLNLLNHMTYLTQDIFASKNNRIRLEDFYKNLFNNTNPEVIDSLTLIEIGDIADTLEELRLLQVKRDRIQFLFEQSKASAIRAAIPSPASILNVVASFDVKKVILSLTSMAITSVNNYYSASESADLQRLQAEWELDDKEAERVHSSKKQSFYYLTNMVKDYQLKGLDTLPSDRIDEFVAKKNDPNISSRIFFYEENEKIFKSFGPYWLELAYCYFMDEQYEKCLISLERYKELDIQIFRYDLDYASTLPYAIIALKEISNNDDYVKKVGFYCQEILDNITSSDWESRFIVAQTYIDCYRLSGNRSFLEEAYKLLKINVNTLVPVQRSMNDAYLADVEIIPTPNDATEEKKKEIKTENDRRNEVRKTELPPVNKPLLVNCEMLFALGKELSIPDSEWLNIDKLMHFNNEPLFLTDSIDDLFYSYDKPDRERNVYLDRGSIIFHVPYVSEYSRIAMVIYDPIRGNTKSIMEDWRVNSVWRNQKEDVSTFTVQYLSDKAKNFSYQEGQIITICIDYNDNEIPTREFTYHVIQSKTEWYEQINVFDDGLRFVEET